MDTTRVDAVQLRVLVLISGRGSNLGALLAAAAMAGAAFKVVAVIADRAAAGLDLAAAAGVANEHIERAAFADRPSFEAALSERIAAHRPDLIVLAGFMRVLSAEFVRAHAGRLINIHPSLLPRYPGLHTHQRALDAGDSEHGASVHLVIPELDAGPVLAQVRLPILPGDTSEQLAQRLLPLEHRLLVVCVDAIARGWVTVQSAGFSIAGHEYTHPFTLAPTGQLLRADGRPLAEL